MNELVTQIRRFLAAMPRKDAASFRLVRREWSGRPSNVPGASIIALARQLVPLGLRECIFAYETIFHHQANPGALTKKDVICRCFPLRERVLKKTSLHLHSERRRVSSPRIQLSSRRSSSLRHRRMSLWIRVVRLACRRALQPAGRM
jgi:hypothetical protein